jgi:hypothetical protein
LNLSLPFRSAVASALLPVSLLALAPACSSTQQRTSFTEEAPPPATDFGETQPLPEEDLYANDPPPKWCGPKGGEEAPPLPGGTEQCPSDKNKPGCACDTLGEKVACWTGLRANRGLGVCKDGVATCTQLSENVRGWGPCEGQVLPTKGSAAGSSACRCFSEGEWKIDNVVPCTVPYPGGASYMVSTVLNPTTGKAECPSISPTPPPSKPLTAWSPTSLKVDCAGHYELCFAIKAGNPDDPKASDCTITKQCVTADYLKSGLTQKLPPLAAWVSTDTACVQKWRTMGGYSEATVKGLSVRCDAIDDGAGNPYVIRRTSYCPEKCSENPSLPECKRCQQGGGGEF